MLGKQWLNRYDSADMRGSATERSQDRQRKLDGIVAWYFDHVLQSLPLMLQAALLLLGCALSRYLWEVNLAVALVILVVTSFGVICYVFIVIAGTAFESCPYQTPYSRIFRRVIYHNLLPILHSVSSAVSAALSKFSRLVRSSASHSAFTGARSSLTPPWYSMNNVAIFLKYFFVSMPVALVSDAFPPTAPRVGSKLGYFFGNCPRVCRQTLKRLMDRWSMATSPPTRVLKRRMVVLDLRCISWVLQTSLDKTIRLSALDHLVSISELSHFHPAIILDCFNIFVGCVSVSNGRVVVIQGLEELARLSATGFFDSFHNLTIMDPTLSVLADLRRRYHAIFPSDTDFTGLPFHSTMTKIHLLATRFDIPRYISWKSHKVSSQEHLPFSRRIAEAARLTFEQTLRRKVPRWTLRSAFHLLSLGSVFPPSVVADCLMIIALDVGCDVEFTISLGERCVRIWWLFPLLILNQRRSGAIIKSHYSRTRNNR